MKRNILVTHKERVEFGTTASDLRKAKASEKKMKTVGKNQNLPHVKKQTLEGVTEVPVGYRSIDDYIRALELNCKVIPYHEGSHIELERVKEEINKGEKSES